MRMKRLVPAAVLAVVVAAGLATTAAARPTPSLPGLRHATTKFHSVTLAERHGYAKFSDVNGITCIADPGMPGMPGMGSLGAMGVHYVNGALVNDPAINRLRPEAMVYRPDGQGNLHLAAVEYIVVKSAWDATHAHAPVLFGHTFMTTTAPNRFGLPTFYSLHVWAYDHNPSGTFAMWNPRVHCPPVG